MDWGCLIIWLGSWTMEHFVLGPWSQGKGVWYHMGYCFNNGGVTFIYCLFLITSDHITESVLVCLGENFAYWSLCCGVDNFLLYLIQCEASFPIIKQLGTLCRGYSCGWYSVNGGWTTEQNQLEEFWYGTTYQYINRTPGTRLFSEGLFHLAGGAEWRLQYWQGQVKNCSNDSHMLQWRQCVVGETLATGLGKDCWTSFRLIFISQNNIRCWTQLFSYLWSGLGSELIFN